MNASMFFAIMAIVGGCMCLTTPSVGVVSIVVGCAGVGGGVVMVILNLIRS